MNTTILLILDVSISFIATILGSSIVFLFKENISNKLSSIINGFSAGIMLSASIWGLLIPSIENSSHLNNLYFLPPTIGVLIGCFFIVIIDIIFKKINSSKQSNPGELKLKRFFVAFTVHNIPEGLAIGFALGNALSLNTTVSLISALMLAIGIAIQNIPEGAAVSLPVYKHTKSKTKGFYMGILSGIVEPIFAVIGILLATQIKDLLPWLLSFSAGAMIFVTINDLIPESKHDDLPTLGTWWFIFGFVLMMILDITLG